VLSLTRGIYVVGILSLFIIPFLLKEKSIFSKGAYKFTIIIFLMLFLVQIILPNLDFKAILNKRFESFIYKETFSKSYETRLEGQKTELELWADGILLFGEGSSLPTEYETANPEITGALYHVAYSTYLAHYGIIGLFLYGFAMPVSTIFIAKKVYSKSLSNYGSRIALISIFCSLFDILSLPWSHHHLFATSHISGLIYGSVWGLYHSDKIVERLRMSYEYNISHTTHH
jgi:membrane associated rhomboid family serine protease